MTGCSGSTALSGKAMDLCTQAETKVAACNGVDLCQVSLDGGVSCADMAGAAPMANPAEVADCAAQVDKGNPVYWNAYFACYLDGKTMSCDGDKKACQDVAVAKAPARDADAQLAKACDAYYQRCTNPDLNPDYCAASILYSSDAITQALPCLSGDCAAAQACIKAAVGG